ncbi:MAG: hypoxanthine-guanine phosphoribosyltransferase, partial [Burkholderiales bacterium]|nr:hypoxanthine-guanine phosphoribosyltransferase [Burkholderiales bacterium]
MNISAEQAWRILESAEEVCSAAAVSEAVSRLAREITAGFRDRDPLVLAIMRGSVMFSGQLLPQLRFPLEFDYLDVTRYGAATRGGVLSWKVSPGTAVAGRVVLVLDDILDEGHTLAAIRDRLIEAGARE